MEYLNYSVSKENDQYLMLKGGFFFDYLMIDEDVILDDDMCGELYHLFHAIEVYERKNRRTFSDEVAILRNSRLGQYLETYTDGENIINEDCYVSHSKVVGAYDIATDKENFKMSNRILPLFKARVEGTKQELMEIYSEEVLDYILSHSNYEKYLDSLSNPLPFVDDVSYIYDEKQRKLIQDHLKRGKEKVKSILNG